MFGLGWLALRGARDALSQGQLERAEELLRKSSTQGHRRVTELKKQLAQAFVRRGLQSLDSHDTEAAWRDALKAEESHPAEKSIARLRQALTGLALSEVSGLLQAGNVTRASQVIDQLRGRGVKHTELGLLQEVARHWLEAKEAADLGKHALAAEKLDRVPRLQIADNPWLNQLRDRVREQQARLPTLSAQLRKATEENRWNDALEISEDLLALAPLHPESKRIRQQAWQSLEPVTVIERPTLPQAQPRSSEREETFQRFCLWIDGVAGFLVCSGRNVTLGQAAPNASIDVPIVADISRKHATLLRDDEGGYVMEASRPVKVNGREARRSLLKSGDRITLGATCQLQFHKPLGTSTSARLEIISGHRIAEGTEEVILLGDGLVLGPGDDVHIRVSDLDKNIVLFRTKDGLGVKSAEPLWVNDEKIEGRTFIKSEATVRTKKCSFAIESLT